ncbi:MAG TPA: hypothetical protein VK590_03205, partial [Saprospiraceae bacterium]|nr:hypothetical protein [Saprospiraceae bacterium]
KSAWWAFGMCIDVKEYVTGEHNDPADCPSYYDGCNCVTSIWNENERLLKMVRDRNPNDLLKKIV